MLDQNDVQIGSDTLRIESLPATKALTLLAELTAIASGVGAGISDLPSSLNEIEKAFNLGKMLEGLLSKIDPEKTPVLIKRIIRDSLPVWNDQVPSAFDDWYDNRFSRKLDDLGILLFAIFEWNFGDPVDWVKKILAKLPKIGPDLETGPDKQSTPS